MNVSSISHREIQNAMLSFGAIFFARSHIHTLD